MKVDSKDSGIGRMVAVPAGTVDLRDDRSKRAWTVELGAFSIGVFPVTVAEYRRSELEGDALIPITGVSWFDAIEFCNGRSRREGLEPCYRIPTSVSDGLEVVYDQAASGYRLPTEAEWQYACRAGTPGYCYGELDEIAWHRDNSNGTIQKVGAKAPNAWGLFDMLGNVWEWCWDLYDVDVYGPYRIFRGGSWAEEPRACGATSRRRSHPTFAIDDLGFRLARTLA